MGEPEIVDSDCVLIPEIDGGQQIAGNDLLRFRDSCERAKEH